MREGHTPHMNVSKATVTSRLPVPIFLEVPMPPKGNTQEISSGFSLPQSPASHKHCLTGKWKVFLVR